MRFKEFLQPKPKEVMYEVHDQLNTPISGITIVSPKTGMKLVFGGFCGSNVAMKAIVEKISSVPGEVKRIPFTKQEILTIMNHHKINEEIDFTVLQKFLTNFVQSKVSSAVKSGFDEKSKVDITRNVVVGKSLSMQINVRGPWKIELSDLDVAWESVREIIKETIQDFQMFGYTLSVDILKRGPTQALFGISIK